MAINFATETLKTIISKGAIFAASDVTTSDSAVAKFKAQDTQTPTKTQTTDGQDTHPQGTGGSHATSGSTTAPAFPSLPNGTLSDSALTELKAAYTEVKTALDDAGTDLTPHGTVGHGTVGHGTVGHGAGTGQGGSPLVKALTEATGEAAGAVREVLQQVHAVLRQEHTAQSGNQAGDHTNGGQTNSTQTNSTGTFWHDRLAQQDHTATDTTAATKITAGTGTETGTTTQTAAGTDAKASVGSATDTTATDAKADTAKDEAGTNNTGKDTDAGHKMADGHLWHDRLAQQDGATTSDGTAAEWHRLVTHDDHQPGADQGATAPALTTELTSAVDHFVQTLDDLHIGQAHGHAADQAAQTAA
ncbi:hypothetical protein [Azospirillum rugosum]|uniref:Uncharacterized protein n=1 Tax=Azospirillum rugosum TaxID=416170 RepID=A0ABS4SQV3_9PROT|nr:hypothetical protein [Azospirillum rugosum]MBP2294337.1 hypothetical protein [Azospirillum rugosum]MDQ0527672.1 hypothetical protein [Azospirillum rugosum]